MLDYKTVKEKTPAECYNELLSSQARGVVNGKAYFGDPERSLGQGIVDLLGPEITLLKSTKNLTGQTLRVVAAYHYLKAESLPKDVRNIAIFKIKAAVYLLELDDKVDVLDIA